MDPITFEFRINYKILDNNDKTIIHENVLEESSELVEHIKAYLDEIISDDIIPPECELCDIERDELYMDHAIYRYDIVTGDESIDMNEVLLSYFKQQINVLYTMDNDYRIIITSVDKI